MTEEARPYRPLIDTPYLFLEFARIPEQKGHVYEALDNWLSNYGLLGLSRQDPQTSLHWVPEPKLVPCSDWVPELTIPPLRYDDAGGSGDTFHAYMFEASKANKLLTLYEALLNRDTEGLEQCFALHEGCTPETLREVWGKSAEEAREENLRRKDSEVVVQEILDDMLVYRTLPDRWETYLVNKALFDIWEMVGSTLSIFAYPSITAMDSSGPLTPHKLTSTMRARNLLGAIYLQFYWLVTSVDKLTRCKHCGRIISYAQPVAGSGKRKPRKDKQFCDSRCRQNYHYQNRTKPARKSKHRPD